MPFLCSISNAVCGQSSFLHWECCVVLKYHRQYPRFSFFVCSFVFLCDLVRPLFRCVQCYVFLTVSENCIAACAMQRRAFPESCSLLRATTWCKTSTTNAELTFSPHHRLLFSWREAWSRGDFLFCSVSCFNIIFWFCFPHHNFTPLTVSPPWIHGADMESVQKLSFLVQLFSSHLFHHCWHWFPSDQSLIKSSFRGFRGEFWTIPVPGTFSSRATGQWRQCVTVLQTLVWRFKPLEQDMNVLVFGLIRRIVVSTRIPNVI